MNPDSSLSDDDHRTRLEAHRPAVRSGIYCRAAYSTFTRYVDDIFNADCSTHAIKSPRCHLSTDNARPHTARLSQQCLRDNDVTTMAARSPDLSPIEHVWTRWEGNCSRPGDTGELTAQMQRLWQDLPQGVISDLIESMPRRISACIAARGGFTTY
ncbi:DDE_3 domain-containing protein [Trichonephila clavipes]|nr:DDE_3 domain-containing protein [Trichonephila clavipes]